MSTFHLIVVTQDNPHHRHPTPSVTSILREAVAKAEAAGHTVQSAELDDAVGKHDLKAKAG